MRRRRLPEHLSCLQLMPQAEARLTAGDPVKNARALLRYALPIDNGSVRKIQVRLCACHHTAGHVDCLATSKSISSLAVG